MTDITYQFLSFGPDILIPANSGGGGSSGASINDNVPSLITTYSSQKVETLLSTFYLETNFLPLLTGANSFTISTTAFNKRGDNVFSFNNHNSSSIVILPKYSSDLNGCNIRIINLSNTADLTFQIQDDLDQNAIQIVYKVIKEYQDHNSYLDIKYINNEIFIF